MSTKRIKLIYLAFLSAVLSFVVHNFFLEIMKMNDWFFLGLFILFILGFFVLLFYSIMEFIVDKEPVDLWKVGFLGIFGLLGLIPTLTPTFGFFALFVLFGMRNYY